MVGVCQKNLQIDSGIQKLRHTDALVGGGSRDMVDQMTQELSMKQKFSVQHACNCVPCCSSVPCLQLWASMSS